MNPKEKYYEASLERANRYHLNLDDLQNVESVDELVNGYCVVPNENDEISVRAYKDKKVIAESGRFNIYRFLMLRLFLDKYRTGKHELPVLTKTRLVGQSEEEAIQWNRRAMEILLRPLDTYADLLARIDEAEEELRWNIKNIETFNGYESEEDGCRALNGERPDYEDDAYRVIRPVSEGVWDVFSKKERSSERVFMLRIYGRPYLHEYILNTHLWAVG